MKAKVCETDWNPIFAALQAAVIEGTELPCVFDIPEDPEGEDIDTEEVNVLYTAPGGEPVTLSRVDSQSACGTSQGWYYDDPALPSQIIVCPATCDLFTAAGEGQVDFQFVGTCLWDGSQCVDGYENSCPAVVLSGPYCYCW